MRKYTSYTYLLIICLSILPYLSYGQIGYRFEHTPDSCSPQTLADDPSDGSDGAYIVVRDCYRVTSDGTTTVLSTAGQYDMTSLPSLIAYDLFESYNTCLFKGDFAGECVGPNLFERGGSFCCQNTRFANENDEFTGFTSEDYQQGSYLPAIPGSPRYFTDARRRLNYEIKPIVTVRQADPGDALFNTNDDKICGPGSFRLNATSGWSSGKYRWFYTTKTSNPQPSDWVRFTGLSGNTVDIDVTDFGSNVSNILNRNLLIGVAIGSSSCADCVPNNMADNFVATGIQFQVASPPVSSASSVRPVCVDGEGSFNIIHGTSSPVGSTFTYTVTQLIFSETGNCDLNPNLPDGINSRTLSGITSDRSYINSYANTDRFCTGFIGNFNFTINSSSL
ncbi:MAG: hypothetical protein WBA74_00600, partial [Cyclobacteriaceae bacterium]